MTPLRIFLLLAMSAMTATFAHASEAIELWGDPTFETKGGLRTQHPEHYRLAITPAGVLIASNLSGQNAGSGRSYQSVKVGSRGGSGCRRVGNEQVCFHLAMSGEETGTLDVTSTSRVNGGKVEYRTGFVFQGGGGSCSAQISYARRTYWDDPGNWYDPVAASDTTCTVTR